MNEGFRPKVDKEPTQDDFIFSNEELDLNLSSDETVNDSLDKAAQEARRIEQAEVAAKIKAEEEAKKQAVLKRLGVSDSYNPEERIPLSGRMANVFEFKKPTQAEESDFEGLSSKDFAEVNETKREEEKDATEIEAGLEKLRREQQRKAA